MLRAFATESGSLDVGALYLQRTEALEARRKQLAGKKVCSSCQALMENTFKYKLRSIELFGKTLVDCHVGCRHWDITSGTEGAWLLVKGTQGCADRL